MMIANGTQLVCRETSEKFVVTEVDDGQISYDGKTGIGLCDSRYILDLFEIEYSHGR